LVARTNGKKRLRARSTHVLDMTGDRWRSSISETLFSHGKEELLDVHLSQVNDARRSNRPKKRDL
jgi:hypothetical protein